MLALMAPAESSIPRINPTTYSRNARTNIRTFAYPELTNARTAEIHPLCPNERSISHSPWSSDVCPERKRSYRHTDVRTYVQSKLRPQLHSRDVIYGPFAAAAAAASLDLLHLHSARAPKLLLYYR